MPAGPVSLSMRSELNKEACFTVNHYTITKDKKGYELKETETRRNVAESVMKISDLTKTYDEFSFEGGKASDATEVKPDVFDITVTIAGDNSTVINMYYGPKVSSGGGGGGGKAPSIVISDTDPTIKKDENQNADDALKNVQVKNGKIIYVPVPGEIQKEGYKFLGYFYDEKFTKPVKVGDKITGDMNFFAQ
ncbi:MAG: hypothetical protein MJ246_06980 [Clostridia bacterium]|nr:hypothetical protein [Clostridia bacterium]